MKIVSSGRNKKINIPCMRIIVAFVIIYAVFIHFYNIGSSFSTNGIDEGIHLLQSHMVSNGYDYYNDAGGDQAPLGIMLFSFINSWIWSRVFTASMFILAVFLTGIMVKKRFGKNPAFIVLIILLLDFTTVREARLASLDSLSASVTSIAAILIWHSSSATSKKPNWKVPVGKSNLEKQIFLLTGGLFLGAGIMIKLFSAPFTVFLFLFFVFLELNRRESFNNFFNSIFNRIFIGRNADPKKRLGREMSFIRIPEYGSIIFLVGILIPFFIMSYIFGIDELLNGIIFRQSHRDFDIMSKGTIFLFLGTSFPLLLF